MLEVATAARSAFSVPLDSRKLFVRVVVFHSSTRQRFDIHNMAKPIFDALEGVAYYDDVQILRAEQSKRPLGGSYQLANPEGRVVANLAEQKEFVYLQFFELTEQEVGQL